MSKKWNGEMSRNNRDMFETPEYVERYQAYKALALAVCEQAVKDYKDLYTTGRESFEPDLRDTVESSEKFFMSDAFDLLSCGVVDGQQVIAAVRASGGQSKKPRCVMDVLPDIVGEGVTPVRVIAEQTGFAAKSIRDAVNRSEDYKLENGLVYKVKEDD